MKYATLTYRVKRQSESPSEEWAEMWRPSRSSGEFPSGKEPLHFWDILNRIGHDLRRFRIPNDRRM